MKYAPCATALYLAALAACFTATDVQAKEVTVGRWTLKSATGSNGNPFCTISTGTQEDGFSLQVTSDGSLALASASPAWTYTPNQRVPAKFSLDGSPTWEGDAVAVTPRILVNLMPTSQDVVARILGAKTLAVTVDGGSAASFDMSGSKEAGEALSSCTAAFPPKT